MNAVDRAGFAAYQERMANQPRRLSSQEAEALRVFLHTTQVSSFEMRQVAYMYYTEGFLAQVRAACAKIGAALEVAE
jgi:hypothetical protein